MHGTPIDIASLCRRIICLAARPHEPARSTSVQMEKIDLDVLSEGTMIRSMD